MFSSNNPIDNLAVKTAANALSRSTSKADLEPQKAPSIWVFLAIDSVTFSILFLVFMIERLKQPEIFITSAQHLNTIAGLINTLILITGSWLVALAVTSAREGDGRKTRKFLITAIGVSSLFAMIKCFEYGSKISEGVTLATNEFFSFYFVLTGFHLVHYVLGMIALIYLASTSTSANVQNASYRYWLESCALFWHLVDLLWIFIFAMLYLLGGQI